MNDPAAIAQISTFIYQALVTAHETQPSFLSDPYRQKNWGSDRNRTILLEKLTAELTRATNPFQRTQEILQKLTTPAFACSPEYSQLMQAVQAVLSKPDAVPEQPGGIAALLMDAENLRLSEAEEGAIAHLCQHPLHGKIAFGNWKNLNGHDVQFHRRGYQLIHVPAGKNAADIQMTAVGASLFLYYPHLREVIVCSSDEHLIPLRNVLLASGLSVHLVSRKEEKLLISRSTGEKVAIPAKPEGTQAKATSPQSEKSAQSGKVSADSISADARMADLESKLVQLLKELKPQTDNGYISIGLLGHHFNQAQGKSVTTLLKELKLPSGYLKFLQKCPKLQLRQVNQEWQVALV